MSSAVELAARAGDAVLTWVVPMTLATGAILVAALVVDRLLERRVSASLRLWLYAAVLARLALPAAWQNPLGVLGSSSSGTVVPGELDLSMVTVVALDPAPASWGSTWAILGYLAVALALLGWWLRARLALRRRLQAAVPLDLVADGVPVLRHPELGPLVAGLWGPRIVIPAALAENAQSEALDWVLRHERAHVLRRDPLIGALAQLACIAAWPILPVWIAVLRIRALMEVACDERAVKGVDRAGRRRYGELLLSLAEGTSASRTLAPVLSFGSPLKGRLRALAARRRWPVVVQALVVAVMGAVVLACAAEPSPDEVPALADAQPDLASDVAPGSSSSPSSASPARTKFWLPPAARDLTGPGESVSKTAARGSGLVDPSLVKSTAVPRRRPMVAAPDGSHAPTVNIDYKGTIWLQTPGLGSLRVGDALPLEASLREALAETGSRTVIVQTLSNAHAETVARVVQAAKRAGATDFAVTTLPGMRRPPSTAPNGQRPAPQRGGHGPIVTITRGLELYVYSKRVAPEMLEAELRGDLEWLKLSSVVIRSDGSVPAGKVDEIAAIARRAGATDVSRLSTFEGPIPEVIPGGAAVRGSLDKELIRRTIRAHIGEVRECYERQLLHQPTLSGRISVQFTISTTGEVTASTLAQSTLGNPKVESCVVQAIRFWQFPRPDGGIVIVTYPFSFSPSDGPPRPSLESGAIKEALAPHQEAIRACYEEHLRMSHAEGGRMVFSWLVAPSGEVSDVKLSGQDAATGIGPCVARVISGVRFAPLVGITGPLRIEFPFVFQGR